MQDFSSEDILLNVYVLWNFARSRDEIHDYRIFNEICITHEPM
jgi:hypothetical protein